MPPSLDFVAVGQALIHQQLQKARSLDFFRLTQFIEQSDVAFTNYEASLASPIDEPPSGTHPSPPETLENLRSMGFNLLSLANNHAFEGGREGIAYTRARAESLGFTAAGTGANLKEATQARFLEIQGVRIALIAMDSANRQTSHSIAGEGGEGVNPLRAIPTEDSREYTLNAEDVERNLAAVRKAAAEADYVIVSFHEHLWPGVWRDVAFSSSWPEDWIPIREWKRAFTHQLIDAGASTVLCHGVPRAAAVEVFRGRPIFHSLGNFIFHLRDATWWPMKEVWNSYIVKAELEGGTLRNIRLLPIVIADGQGEEDGPVCSRLYPKLSRSAEAIALLERVAAESRKLGTDLSIIGEEGRLSLPV